MLPQKLVENAILLCGPWKDEYQGTGGVRRECELCQAYVVIAEENVQNVEHHKLHLVCNPCFALLTLSTDKPIEIGGYLLGELFSQNPAAKGPKN